MKAKIKIFLSYAREDETAVDQLYQRLSDVGFTPWMDRRDILPGERWDTSIENAILNSDFFLACLSTRSIGKRGVIQRELEDALSIWQEMSLRDIYLIPVRLEECDMPRILRHLQWVNLFEGDGWARLLQAIQVGMSRRGVVVETAEEEVAAPGKPEPTLPIQRIAASLRHGWVADPWHAGNPYQAMESLFIGPRSSMHEIRDSSPAQQNDQQKNAWQRLQSLPSRLFVDSFLYQTEKSRELIAAVKGLPATEHQLPALKQVPPSLQKEWPLILLLAGRRKEGLSAWADIVRTAGEHTDPAVIHSLAIAYTFEAQQQEKEGQIEAAVIAWRRAMAYWAWILDRDDYWSAWASRRDRHYQVRVTPEHVSRLRRQLVDHFAERFAAADHALPADCPEEIRRAFAELSAEWAVEQAGMQALKRLQAEQPDTKRIKPEVGPLLLRELGLDQALAQLVSERTNEAEDIVFLLTTAQDAQEARQRVQAVRLCYSQLGRALAWLDASQPERALAAMPAEGSDEDFDQQNPPYRLLPDKRAAWDRDRAELIMRAHLQLAGEHLQRQPWDVEAIATQWAQALSYSGALVDADQAMGKIQAQVLGHIQPIAEDKDEQLQQLALAEAARQVIGPSPQLDSILKGLRSIQHKRKAVTEPPSKTELDLRSLLGEDTDQEKPPDTLWQAQAKKLYTVLQANPADEDTRDELARLLADQLEGMIFDDDLEAARQIADEWCAKLEKHPLLWAPCQYLQHGYKIEAYLEQTELIYHPNLLETYSYSLPWRMKHKDHIVVKLEIEGELVRVFAPLFRPEDMPSAEIQHHLLQASWDTPLYKTYLRPNGEIGMMVEVLAHSLTPALLDQLVRYLAFRVDLSPERLQSLDSLREVMQEHVPNLSLRAGEPPAESDFERWQSQLLAQCRQKDLQCTLAGGFAYRLERHTGRGEAIQLEFQDSLVTFQTRLGDQYQMDHRLYERMMGWNHSHRICKLVLAPDGATVFRCEVLDLEGEGMIAHLLALVLEGLAQAESLLAWHIL